MSESGGSTPKPTQAKSKLDGLSREDLVRLLKKQSELSRQHKDEIAQWKAKAEEHSASLEKERARNAELEECKTSVEQRLSERDSLAAAAAKGDGQEGEQSAAFLLLKARVTEMEVERDEARRRAEEVEGKKRQHDVKAADELAGLRGLADELRAQLDDARTEVTTLKERNSSAAVVDMELKDYEKKVSILQKEQKECVSRLAEAQSVLVEWEKKREELEKERKRAETQRDDEKQAREKAETKARELEIECGEQSRLVASLRNESETREEERGSREGHLALELAESTARVSSLEEAVHALREESVRLRREREAADARAEGVDKEFQEFKVRSRYILEQRQMGKKEDESKEAMAALEKRAADAEKALEDMRVEHYTLSSDVSRLQAECARAEAETQRAKRERDEVEQRQSTGLDSLRECRLELERVRSECEGLRDRTAEAEQREVDKERERARLSTEMSLLRSRLEDEMMVVKQQLDGERSRREEAQKQLAAMHDTRVVAVKREREVAAVYPQFSESHTCVTDSIAGLQRAGSVMSEKGKEAADRSLEDVLFGEEAINEPVPIGDIGPVVSMEECVLEVDRLRKQLLHTSELLHESEGERARMEEQGGVLKEEIRRLLRNEERQTHAANTEYLKNVIVKFLRPQKVSEERRQLIPILSTMLSLSREEVELLERAAAVDTSADSSWSSYIPKWG